VVRSAINDVDPNHMVELDIALGLGMRLSEQYGLRWAQVDFIEKVVRLGKTKNFNGRSIPMNSSVEAAFIELRKRAPKAKLNELVFEQFPRSWWEDVMEKSGITDFRWHDLRHSFCSRLVKKGVNLKVIQLLAGHKTIVTTARYAHADDADLRSAVDTLATSFGPAA
jgi:site-specific recombinase XerD